MPYERISSLQVRNWLLTLVTGLALFGLLLVPNSKADEMDKKIILTFSNRVQFPGIALDQGTYVVKRVDYNVGKMPDVLEIANKNETHVFGIVKAIPVERFHPAERVEVTFYETLGLAPPAVRELWYPGERIGEQFVYPKGGPVVMALAGEKVTAEPAAAPIESQAPSPEVSTTPNPPAPEEQPAEQPTPEIAQATPPPAPAPAEPAPAPTQLPATASDLPLLALVGGLILAAGTGLKFLAKQSN